MNPLLLWQLELSYVVKVPFNDAPRPIFYCPNFLCGQVEYAKIPLLTVYNPIPAAFPHPL